MLSHQDLTTSLTALGIAPGDTLLVHSAYKALGGVEGRAGTVIEALLDVLSPEGTLIMPNFNFDFCRGEPWDVRSTPSHMGILTELARQDPRSCRVFHPIYSFAIIGKHQQQLCSKRYQSSYGADSVFGQLRELDGKIMVIGLSYNNSMTFFHHVEEMQGVDYRYMKTFSGPVTDWDGSASEQSFTMLVRDIEKGVHTMVDPMGAQMEQDGVIQVGQIGEAKVSVMTANDIYAYTAEHMTPEPGLLYEIHE
jgi:aminoglycoside 3-N-acetyltransferase